jgi:hypothetical protein
MEALEENSFIRAGTASGKRANIVLLLSQAF